MSPSMAVVGWSEDVFGASTFLLCFISHSSKAFLGVGIRFQRDIFEL